MCIEPAHKSNPRQTREEKSANGEQQMDRHGGEHMDPVQLRRILRLRNLLLRAQVQPRLRPIHPRHRLRLQGHRRQRRRTLRPPLLRRRRQPRPILLLRRAVGGPGLRRDPVLRGLLPHVAVGGRTVTRPPVALMCFYMLMAAHATSFFNTANVVTGVNNFPNYRGTIVGIMKVRFVLSSFLISNSIGIFFFCNYA